MSSPIDTGQYLLGKIDAVEMLACALAAHLSPPIASVLLAQCAILREKAIKGEVLSAYEKGFCEIEQKLLLSLKQVSDAEKIRSLPDGAKH